MQGDVDAIVHLRRDVQRDARKNEVRLIVGSVVVVPVLLLELVLLEPPETPVT